MRSLRSTLLLLLSVTATGYLLPDPPGKYNVTLSTGTLTDRTRHVTSAGTTLPRTLVLSVFQPAKCTSTVAVEYMPDEVADFQGPFLQAVFNVSFDLTPIFREARLQVCPNKADACSTQEDAPVILFSPGYSIPRYYYNVLASAMASHGFTVITFDSPGDANIIVYPDGDVIYNNDTVQSLALIEKQIPPVTKDFSFIVDQLSNATAMGELLPKRGPRALSPGRVAAMGHSLGGVTAVLAAGKDTRIRGAINWDGTFLDQPSSGVSQPVLLMSHGMADPSWWATWPLLKGPKLWLNVANTTHETFSDVPTLLQSAGQDATGLNGLLGTIEPAKMLKILVEYSTAWMSGAFAGRLEWPLRGAGKPSEFAELEVVKRRDF